jgi:hypothetical protein
MQTLDAIPLISKPKCVTCCYVNATSSVQVARISNIENWYFERVVFPGQRLIFEAFPEAKLEIHTGTMASSVLADILNCEDLKLEHLDPSPDGYRLE